MNIQEIIGKKRDSKELSKEEIEYFIENYTNGNIADYQAAALIMAIYINGMTDKETLNLTFSMANSGEILDLSEFGENVVDKHSTGGVGDKVSLILLPIIASLGIPVAKMSGRGLGFTGGTIDKLESIPGYNTQIDINTFKENVKNIGISIIGQTLNLAPADKKIYSLRDGINCVESIPLIASSIMSKKIASGANKIVLEVTYGKGAFMKDLQSAKILADEMIKLGNLANKEVVAIYTEMNQPLGYAIGNTLEVIEAINFLSGKNLPKDLKEVILDLGSNMIKLAGKGESLKENKKLIMEQINNGKALQKFKQLVECQGGDISYIEDTSKFKTAKYKYELISQKDGIIKDLNAEQIGNIVCFLGGGRIKKEDEIDYDVGIILNKKVGDYVKKGDLLCTIFANSKEKLAEMGGNGDASFFHILNFCQLVPVLF